MKESKKLPLSSFGPELRAIYAAGAKGKKELDFRFLRDARNLQARLHIFRNRLAEEGDPFHSVAAGVRITLQCAVRKADQPAKLIAQPHDKQYDDVLKAAGIEMAEVALKSDVPSPGAEPYDPLLDMSPAPKKPGEA